MQKIVKIGLTLDENLRDDISKVRTSRGPWKMGSDYKKLAQKNTFVHLNWCANL